MDNYKDRLKVYYDAEMTELSMNGLLISIAFLSESGAYFYAECPWYDANSNRYPISDWIKDNVVANLLFNDRTEVVETSEFVDDNDCLHHSYMVKGGPRMICDWMTSWIERELIASGHKKIQFYTDCYAYDWALLMDLICVNGNALNVPDNIDYIPIDLSTWIYLHDMDPDISREELAGSMFVEQLQNTEPFNRLLTPKHNSLWDAYIARKCFMNLGAENKKEKKKEIVTEVGINKNGMIKDVSLVQQIVDESVEE